MQIWSLATQLAAVVDVVVVVVVVVDVVVVGVVVVAVVVVVVPSVVVVEETAAHFIPSYAENTLQSEDPEQQVVIAPEVKSMQISFFATQLQPQLPLQQHLQLQLQLLLPH